MLQGLLKKKLLDYIAMDIKAPLSKYEEVCGILAPVREIQQSISLIMKSGVDYEFRTTVVKGQLTPDDLLEIGKLIKTPGSTFCRNLSRARPMIRSL